MVAGEEEEEERTSVSLTLLLLLWPDMFCGGCCLCFWE